MTDHLTRRSDEPVSEDEPRRSYSTIRDVAALAGVSETTVSLTFQKNSRISAQTRRKVLAAAKKLRYFPNFNARALRMGGLKSIGFLINDIANPFYGGLVNNAETVAKARGFQVVVADGHWDPEREVQAVGNLIHSRVRGMLVCTCEKTRESLDCLSHYSIPCVAVDTVPESYRGAFIGNDLLAAGRLAAEHLMDVNCRRPALLTVDQQMESFSSFAAVKKGFLEGLAQRGVDPESVSVVNAGLTIDAGNYGFQRLVKRVPDVDGILCMNDLCAIGAMEAADAKGIRIGPDVAMIGIDDLDVSATARISLSSLRQPHQRIIELAVNALIDSIESNDAPDINMVLPPELVIRNSTRRTR